MHLPKVRATQTETATARVLASPARPSDKQHSARAQNTMNDVSVELNPKVSRWVSSNRSTHMHPSLMQNRNKALGLRSR